MADDKSNTGAQDRGRVSGLEGYEVDFFAERHSITADQARDLISRIGNSRKELDSAADRLKA